MDNPIAPGQTLNDTYELLPIKGTIKNWIAIEGSILNNNEIMTVSNTKIASSAPRGPQTSDERNVFAIYVSYYVKCKLVLSGMGGELSLKLPFVLGYVENENESENERELLLKTNLFNIDENIIELTHITNTIDVIAEENENSRKSSEIHDDGTMDNDNEILLTSELGTMTINTDDDDEVDLIQAQIHIPEKNIDEKLP